MTNQGDTGYTSIVPQGAAAGGALFRTSTAASAKSSNSKSEGLFQRISRTVSNHPGLGAPKRERIYDESDDDESKPPISKAEDWKLMAEVQGFKDHDSQGRKLGVTWSDLTVKGVASDATYNENFGSQFNILKKIQEGRNKAPLNTILDKSSGCVKPGEMLLVLGRPGSGCTTLLKMLANKREGYASVEGHVQFGNMDHKTAGQYRGQIVINTEEELFFPTLTVGQTIDFATRMKVPQNLPEGETDPLVYQKNQRDFLLKSMGITHTSDTKVGNEFIRGVSGGERKRVSILEVLATRASVFCWDNSTRGLDASSALDYVKAIRALTDVFGMASIITLYQAGNGIYELFDKVLVLDQGQQMYYGPMEKARPFMEEQGFVCSDAANFGDFLTGVVVPTERKIRPGHEQRFPKNAREIRAIYDKTPIKQAMDEELSYPTTDIAKSNTEAFAAAVHFDKSKRLPKKSPLTVSPQKQIFVAIKRQYQILWGDKATFFIKQASTLALALIGGSVFYNAPDSSAGLFIKGGSLFFAILYNSLLAMSEVTDSFTGRPVLAKHRSFALYHPAAFCLAQIVADLPVILFQISIFSVIVYFMVGLTTSAASFFTFWIVLFATTMTMTAFFRMVGAAFTTFDGASKVSGFAISAYVMYSGYLIAKPAMHPWFVWIYWINPVAYAFQSLLANEFRDKIIPCVGNNLIPSGGAYTTQFAACSGVGGARPGASSVTGDEYLGSLSYSTSNVWRNFGIVWCWWVLFVGITIYFTSQWSMGSSGSSLVVPRELAKKHDKNVAMVDEEAQPTSEKEKPEPVSSSSSHTQTEDGKAGGTSLVRNTSIFTWSEMVYTVPTPSGPRVLLDNVQGWVKPGMLGALMGSSGAGKTTLLDVLAGRKTDGTLSGKVLVDGRPLSVSFQRSAGYVEQLDVHEPLTTVREALEFSALLRQSRDTPKAEKLKYVNTIIDLLELHDIADTLVGKTGAGLSVEQRKRLTIGVELVAKPSILIFLDEPTSGLDGQAAFNTVRFLRKLAAAGQAVLVTIHQPSAQLFAQFDTLLLLAKGGKTVYFGEIGDDAATLKDYFARNGAPCPEAVNPAEHMIDVVSGRSNDDKNWNEIWLASPEHDHTVKELAHMVDDAAAKPPGTTEDGHEFATSLWTQTKLVTTRMNKSLYRNTDYTNNKLALHVGSALFNGFTFWNIGNSVGDLQQRLFTIFNFIFVAPGVIAQLQPLFIQRRDIFETREKKSKMYSWVPFTIALIVSEIPYLMLCGVLYYVCWYYTAGLPHDSNRAGATLFVMLAYELFYTGFGQFIAAYAPNAVFASLVNPFLITVLVLFCGVLVPYQAITVFWRYWLYYLNPFTYLMGSLLVFAVWDIPVSCDESELAIFDTPNGQTCSSYLASYQQGAGSMTNLLNPTATSQCRVCQYTTGTDYLATLNLTHYYDGWRDAAIVVIFVFSSYALVFLMMKLRTKQSVKSS